MPLESRIGTLLLAVGAVLFTAGILTVLLFFGVNFDEGYNLQIPRNLVKMGAYASSTSDGLTWFDPFISTGPLLLAPVAISLRILGEGITQARLVSAGYAFLTLLAVALLTRRLFGSLAAGIAVFLLATVDQAFLLLGMVLGEGAALTAMLFGLLLWSHAEEKRDGRPALVAALVAGLLWGLSVWAKPSMAMALLFLGTVVVPKATIRRRFPFGAILVAAMVAAFWFLLPSVHFGLSGAMSQLKGASVLVSMQLDSGIFRNVVHNVPVLFSKLGSAILLGSLAVRASMYQGTQLRLSRLAVCVVSLGWLFWWMLFNRSGDYRHLLPGLILGIVPLSGSLAQLLRGQLRSFGRHGKFVLLALVITSLLFSGVGIANYFLDLRQAKEEKNAEVRFANYIAGLASEARIMAPGWFMAWDVAFLSERPFTQVGYDDDVSDGPAYMVITSTIMRYSGPYEASMQLVGDCSGEVVYDDPPYFRLYELETPCFRE